MMMIKGKNKETGYLFRIKSESTIVSCKPRAYWVWLLLC